MEYEYVCNGCGRKLDYDYYYVAGEYLCECCHQERFNEKEWKELSTDLNNDGEEITSDEYYWSTIDKG